MTQISKLVRQRGKGQELSLSPYLLISLSPFQNAQKPFDFIYMEGGHG